MRLIFICVGVVNKQNLCYWAETNPQKLHERPLHSPKVTVWCAISELEIWHPYFLRKITTLSQSTLTHNARCWNILLGEIWKRLKIWRTCGACRTGQHVTRHGVWLLYCGYFFFRLMSLRGDICWPARSPGLNPCDYSYEITSRPKFFSPSHETTDDWKVAIRIEVALILLSMPRKKLGKLCKSPRFLYSQ